MGWAAGDRDQAIRLASVAGGAMFIDQPPMLPTRSSRVATRRRPHLLMTRAWLLAVLCACAWPLHAFASDGSEPSDPVATLVLSLGLILLGAKFGGHLASRVGQPAVLGELLFGVLIGNLPLLGFTGLEYLATDANLDMLARLGVILLLFEVGLESTVAQMLEVGASSFVVATIGVVTPCVLGYGIGLWLLPHATIYARLFLAAALCATSVGITARVLKDLGQSHTEEARIVLGAAVIDDVMGLVILAVVTGLIGAAEHGTTLSGWHVVWILTKAVLFLVGSLLVGVRLVPRLFSLASNLQARDVLLAIGVSFCFALCWLASRIELAPIVGAFAAGLILEAVHYRDFTERGEHGLDELIKPISALLVPVFFVLMGIRTDLRSFAQPGAPVLALALTVAAILGKQLCYFGVTKRGLDRLSVGIGMIPRGEVGLIFANIGTSLHLGGGPILGPAEYSAVVIMVISTTLVTPPALKWILNRARASRASSRSGDDARP
jgi:Kef-type K+ transport system membrane component KefB